jgi:hypothetical protein
LKSFKVKYSSSIKEFQLFTSTLTHVHLILEHTHDYLGILKNLHNLVHLKLEDTDQDYLMKCSINYIEDFFQKLPDSLKIFELNYVITEAHLVILLNETRLNLQCIKLYNYKHYKNTSLSFFIDYVKKKPCFKELCISREAIQDISKEHIEEARKHFNITLLAYNEMSYPFYGKFYKHIFIYYIYYIY